MRKRSKLIILFIFLLVLVPAYYDIQNIKAATFCSITVSNTNNSGIGSLRQAILDANNSSNTDNICFNISSGHQQIIPTFPMPAIVNPVIIDGTTQSGFSGSPLIELSGNGAGSNAIGLRVTGNGAGSTIRGLIINRFSAQGIFIDTNNVKVAGNYIGTTADGLGKASNGGDGVGIFSGTSIASANNNTVGGTLSMDRNVISGNALNGIGITSQVGGNASNNIISGNYIGTNSIGNSAIANGGDGILINHAGSGAASVANNTVGGSIGTTPYGACTGACNLISGNGANGVGLWHGGVSDSHIYGNFIGTNISGTSSIANSNIGVEINEAPNNTVGGTTPAERNILSGNYGAGVFLTGATTTGNIVQGNFVGTNTSGTGGVGNAKMGIGIGASPNAVGANHNLIGGNGGTTPGGECTGACNLISGNGSNGIFISGTESSNNIIQGNYIGTNISGTNSIGNELDGVGILDTPNIQIGGNNSNERNIISGNGSNGIIIAGNSSTGNAILGNYIGMTTTGTMLGNTASGVAISSGTYTVILSNGIAYNGKIGIDLDNNGSVNLNDNGDSDNGANHLQNFPDIYAARTIGTTTKIGGQFNGAPNSSFRIDFYYSTGCNGAVPKNYGQGQYYIGSTDINTDKFGNTALGYQPASIVTGNTYITATATKKINNIPVETSEFSKCVLVNASKPVLTNGATWFLKDYQTTGPADKTFGYGFPAYLLMCAWDQNQPGVKLPVIYSGGAWFMRASYTTGTADLSFNYGGGAFRPVCGDWDGDGIDSPGVVSSINQWLLRNSNSSGAADAGNFQFGTLSSIPIVGDWDGNGTDTIGSYTGGNWQLRDTNSSGAADYSFSFNPPSSVNAVVGDWDGNGTDTIGIINNTSDWILRNSNTSGIIDVSFKYGFTGTTPLIW